MPRPGRSSISLAWLRLAKLSTRGKPTTRSLRSSVPTKSDFREHGSTVRSASPSLPRGCSEAHQLTQDYDQLGAPHGTAGELTWSTTRASPLSIPRNIGQFFRLVDQLGAIVTAMVAQAGEVVPTGIPCNRGAGAAGHGLASSWSTARRCRRPSTGATPHAGTRQ